MLAPRLYLLKGVGLVLKLRPQIVAFVLLLETELGEDEEDDAGTLAGTLF